MPQSATRLHVCVTCRAGRELMPEETALGMLLHGELQRLLDGAAAPPCELREVVCLASCERGCTASISAPGKWSYLLGDLSPAHAADLLTYAAAFSTAPRGAVLPSRRPASLKSVILGRFPAQDDAA